MKATAKNVFDAIETIFTASDNGCYEGFDIDALAEYMGLTVDEAEDMLIDAENEGYVRDEMDGLYNAEMLSEWEMYNADEEEAEARAEANYRDTVEWEWTHR